MKIHKIEISVIDFEDMGVEEITYILENTRYPNHCINPNVINVKTKDIGEWSDDHPLNCKNTAEDFYKSLFGNK